MMSGAGRHRPRRIGATPRHVMLIVIQLAILSHLYCYHRFSVSFSYGPDSVKNVTNSGYLVTLSNG